MTSNVRANHWVDGAASRDIADPVDNRVLPCWVDVDNAMELGSWQSF